MRARDEKILSNYRTANARHKQREVTRVFNVTLDDGRHIQFFANLETNLIVVDVVDADEQGGNEIVRRTV